MKVTFNSREDAKSDIPLLNNTLIISISDTMEESNEMRALFNDCNNKGSNIFYATNFLDNEEDFSPWLAESMLAFIDKAYELRLDIYVHCFMGVSRSGGVAKLVNDYLGLDIDYINGYSLYNRHVYSCLSIAAGIGINAETSAFNSLD